MAGLPWFKVYPAETLSDEAFQGWDIAERGAWFTLICAAWREGSIPGDQQSLAKLLHLDGSAMRQVWSAIGSKFVDHPDHPGRLTSPRLEREREAAEMLHAKKVGAGKNGARSRWDKPKFKHSRAIAQPKQAHSKALANDSDQDRSGQDRTEAAVELLAAADMTNSGEESAPTPSLDVVDLAQSDQPPRWPLLGPFRQQLAERMAVPSDWFRIAKPDRVAAIRDQIQAEVGRLGLARAVDVAAEAAARASPKPRWLAWFVGALQDAPQEPTRKPLATMPANSPEAFEKEGSPW